MARDREWGNSYAPAPEQYRSLRQGMGPSTLFVTVLLSVCCIREGCSTKRRVIKDINLQLNVETLVLLIEENRANDILTIGPGQFAPGKVTSLGSQTSPPSVSFNDVSLYVYEENGVKYADLQGIIQLRISLASRNSS
jgi:hypothetical protein